MGKKKNRQTEESLNLDQLNPPEPGSPKWHTIGVLSITVWKWEESDWHAKDTEHYVYHSACLAKSFYNKLIEECKSRKAGRYIEAAYLKDVPAWKRSEWGCDEELYADFDGEYLTELGSGEVWCATLHDLLAASHSDDRCTEKRFANNDGVPEDRQWQTDDDDEIWW